MKLENAVNEDGSITYHDEVSKESYIFSKEILITHLQKECSAVNISFDKTYASELKCLSADLSNVLFKYHVGCKNAQKVNNKCQITCGDLIANAANTVMAATQTLRCGFRLQSGMLIRSVIEICATVVDLNTEAGALDKFLSNRYKSTDAISRATKIIPLFGKAWGLLSNHQIHINTNHAEYYSTGEYEDKSDIPANVTLGMIGIATLILEITTELAFAVTLENPKYWKAKDVNQFQFIPPLYNDREWTYSLLKVVEV